MKHLFTNYMCIRRGFIIFPPLLGEGKIRFQCERLLSKAPRAPTYDVQFYGMARMISFAAYRVTTPRTLHATPRAYTLTSLI